MFLNITCYKSLQNCPGCDLCSSLSASSGTRCSSSAAALALKGGIQDPTPTQVKVLFADYNGIQWITMKMNYNELQWIQITMDYNYNDNNGCYNGLQLQWITMTTDYKLQWTTNYNDYNGCYNGLQITMTTNYNGLQWTTISTTMANYNKIMVFSL